MAYIFDNEIGSLRSTYKDVIYSDAGLIAGTPTVPFSMTSFRQLVAQFFLSNETDQEVTIYLRNKDKRLPQDGTAMTGWQLFASIGPTSSFSLGAVTPPGVQLPAGTEFGLVMTASPTLGKIRLFTFG